MAGPDAQPKHPEAQQDAASVCWIRRDGDKLRMLLGVHENEASWLHAVLRQLLIILLTAFSKTGLCLTFASYTYVCDLHLCASNLLFVGKEKNTSKKKKKKKKKKVLALIPLL